MGPTEPVRALYCARAAMPRSNAPEAALGALAGWLVSRPAAGPDPQLRHHGPQGNQP